MDTGIISGIFSTAFWYVAPIIISITTFITGLFNNCFHIEKNWVKQLVSWIVAAGLSVGSWAIHFITFGEPVWLGVVALSIVTGLSSNGFYDIEAIKSFVNKITGKEVTITD